MHCHYLISLLSVYLIGIHATVGHPIHQNSTIHQARQANYVLLGYRYVAQEVAAEYNKRGTLTSIKASQEQTGPGAYLSPALGQWDTPPDYWQCVILADNAKFQPAPKLFVPEQVPPLRDAVLSSWMAYTVRMDQRTTLLFSVINGSPQRYRQLFIPQYYLPRSNVPGKAADNWGPGDLGLQVKCVPKTDNSINYGPVNWGANWQIPGWQPE
ncbi:hypothetical protein C8R46DRAFT_1041529 [Mycena filopes]|nr:hypothetical protein C8R46DRAFT_1041529 [Mycena filopes]